MTKTRTASRRTALSLCLGVGLIATLASTVAMIFDQTGPDSVAGHVQKTYQPHGTIPDPGIPWVFLYSIFGAGALAWTVGLIGAVRGQRWTRWWCTGAFLVGTALLIFLAVVSEHDTPIIPATWRITSIVIAALGAITIVVAWLPTTDRIRE